MFYRYWALFFIIDIAKNIINYYIYIIVCVCVCVCVCVLKVFNKSEITR